MTDRPRCWHPAGPLSYYGKFRSSAAYSPPALLSFPVCRRPVYSLSWSMHGTHSTTQSLTWNKIDHDPSRSRRWRAWCYWPVATRSKICSLCTSASALAWVQQCMRRIVFCCRTAFQHSLSVVSRSPAAQSSETSCRTRSPLARAPRTTAPR